MTSTIEAALIGLIGALIGSWITLFVNRRQLRQQRLLPIVDEVKRICGEALNSQTAKTAREHFDRNRASFFRHELESAIKLRWTPIVGQKK